MDKKNPKLRESTPGSTKSPKFEKESDENSKKHVSDIVPVSELLPPNLFLLPVAQTTMFPGMLVPVILPEGKLAETAETVLGASGYVGIVIVKDAEEGTVATGPSTSVTGLPIEGTVAAVKKLRKGTQGEALEKNLEFYPYGVVAKIVKKINLPDNQVSVLLNGVARFHIKRIASTEPHYVANVEYLYEQVTKDNELEALLRSCLSQFKHLSKDNPLISEEVKVALVNIDGPGKLADLMASVLIHDVANYQQFLEAADVKMRLQHLLLLLKRETDVHKVQKKIQEEINSKISTYQREYYLTEQLKAIQKELGRATDEKTRLLDKFKERLKAKTLSAETKTRIDEEMEKFQTLHEQSSEYGVCLNYLDWATSMPWGVRSEENRDIRKAKQILDQDHFGLKDPKERILEFLAVKKLKKSSEGSILCLVGPPGTGKTSLGKSIARAMNRKFFRFSVGGMRDEAEVKGHRRTYVGAMPGKIIQGLKRVGTQNPVFLIDEIDKLSTGWASGGDPASALLEVLDPEQNREFLDHYLDIPFNCGEVLFITTANTVESIPAPLLDRMEVIPLHGYTDREKMHIAKQYLLPKQMEKNALTSKQLKFSDKALLYMIHRYARESGVRSLEKYIGKICRKVAFQLVSGKAQQVKVNDPKSVEKYLGMVPFAPEVGLAVKTPGVATGLAYTQHGGEVLFIESSVVEGKGDFKLTGSLGEVMQESANIAYSHVMRDADKLKLPKKFFDEHVIHIHVPSGATPKDGPSAGVTLAASLYSLLENRPIRQGLAMTGELTLTGRILPVGGIKEKLLAASRANMKTVLLPENNAKDLMEIEPEVKSSLKIILVGWMKDVRKHLY